MSAIPETVAQTESRRAARSAALRGWLPLAAFVAGLLLFTAVPYAYGYLRAPAGTAFQGIAFNVPDIAQYWSWLRDHQTALLVPNRMTAEPNDPAFFNTLWLVLGQIQRFTGWSEAAIYQLLRLVGATAFLLTLWWFVGLFTATPRARWTAYLLATLGGGLGWIWVVEKYLSRISDVRFPLDLYIVEPNSFFALMTLPHLVVAAAMIMGIFGCFLLAERRGDDPRLYGAATGVALLLGLSHAYDLIMIYAVLGAYVLTQFIAARRILWGRFWGLAAVGLLSFPPAGYFTYLTSRSELWKEVLAQFDNAGIFTPNLLHIPILLGVPFVITVVYGLSLLWRRFGGSRRQESPAREPAIDGPTPALSSHFLWVWTIVGFGLLYIPTDYQIKMLNPYHVPLALLATEAVGRWLEGRRRVGPGRRPAFAARHSALIMALLVAVSLPTNIYLWGWRMLELSRGQAPFFLTDGQVSALDWLDARSEERAVVLSGIDLGQYVPALTAHRAFLAHWAQTVRFYEKRSDVERFFAAQTSPAERHALLERYGVDYVLHGPEERELGGFDPATDAALRPVFTAGDTVVYTVLREP